MGRVVRGQARGRYVGCIRIRCQPSNRHRLSYPVLSCAWADIGSWRKLIAGFQSQAESAFAALGIRPPIPCSW